MLVRRDGKLLLIERKKGAIGFAPPAGHVDGDATFENAAKRELKEEVGLDLVDTKLLAEGRKENPCRREGGSWHYWKIYSIEADGDVRRSPDETKQAGFYSPDELVALSDRTTKYLSGGISEDEWEKLPGIEPVWYEWLKELQIL
jgi:ADP-ribose pyrophosphatase YjhB (NUDIX family)